MLIQESQLLGASEIMGSPIGVCCQAEGSREGEGEGKRVGKGLWKEMGKGEGKRVRKGVEKGVARE